MPSGDYDVLIATDFRHSGGTTASIAQEVEIQARMGLRTGLINIEADYINPNYWAERIQSLVGAGLAELVSPRQAVRARLLVLRHPRVFEHAGWSLAARADHTLMVANQVPQDGARETAYYDVPAVLDRLEAELGERPCWAPIGPAVRQALVASNSPRLELTPFDWHNVIDVDAWAPRRPRVRGPIATIGRHSRDDIKKWPESPADLLAAYPESVSRRVRILGGSAAPEKLLGRRIRRWQVLRFGSVAPEDFLASLDVYVYFHHSGMREAFGRAVLEALASGLPVVTHRYLEPLFGDACAYGEPRDAPAIIDDLLGRQEPNTRGLQLVRERYDWEEHRRRVQRYVNRPLSTIVRRSARRRRILFVTCHDEGTGHLTRQMAIARRLPVDCQPVFLTMSAAVEAVRKLGFWVDYVLPQAMTGLSTSGWNDYFSGRMGVALRTLRPEALIFNGSSVPNGLIHAMVDFPQVRRIWCRHHVWKPTTPDLVEPSVPHLAAFDLVLEPGELAAPADRGITSEQRQLVRSLDPILLLEEREIVPREEARNELGIAPSAVAVLLNLSAGNINRLDAVAKAIDNMMGRNPDVHLVAAESIASMGPAPARSGRISRIETSRLSPVIRAFDFCVAAPGYSSFHELLANAVPTVFIPNLDLDDQVARAEWASREGLSLMTPEDDAEQLERVLRDMLEPAVRDALRNRCRTLPAFGGAQQAADIIGAEGWSPLERIRGPESLRRVKRHGPLVRYPWLVWRTVRKVPGLFRLTTSRTLARLRPGRPQMRRESPTRSTPPRVLVVASESLSAEDGVQELVDWVSSRMAGAVILASAEVLPPLTRLGLTAELLTHQDMPDLADRLDLAAYAREKNRLLVSAYGCGPVISWSDGQLRKQWSSLFSLGG